MIDDIDNFHLNDSDHLTYNELNDSNSKKWREAIDSKI